MTSEGWTFESGSNGAEHSHKLRRKMQQYLNFGEGVIRLSS